MATRIGDYELLTKLGEGGMGAVYQARQISLDRIVALKVLAPKLAADPAFVERFQREARATARLNHSNIVVGIDVGQADGIHYFAMEFVEGETLKARLKREGTLLEPEVLRIGAAIASALAHAHRAGIVHRDVKPENILLDRDGTPKLADLGLAKAFARGAEDGSLTQTGTTVGTPHYIAPEQARGEEQIDGRTDTYALGCTLYHAATGRPPFEGATGAILMVKHISEKMPHPQALRPELSSEFCALLSRMVARNREERYAQLEDAVEDLEALHSGLPPLGPPLPPGKINFLPLASKRLSPSASTRIYLRPAKPEPSESGRPSITAGKKTPAPTLIAAGGAGALVLVAALFALLSGGTPPPAPIPPSKRRPADSNREMAKAPSKPALPPDPAPLRPAPTPPLAARPAPPPEKIPMAPEHPESHTGEPPANPVSTPTPEPAAEPAPQAAKVAPPAVEAVPSYEQLLARAMGSEALADLQAPARSAAGDANSGNPAACTLLAHLLEQAAAVEPAVREYLTGQAGKNVALSMAAGGARRLVKVIGAGASGVELEVGVKREVVPISALAPPSLLEFSRAQLGASKETDARVAAFVLLRGDPDAAKNLFRTAALDWQPGHEALLDARRLAQREEGAGIELQKFTALLAAGKKEEAKALGAQILKKYPDAKAVASLQPPLDQQLAALEIETSGLQGIFLCDAKRLPDGRVALSFDRNNDSHVNELVNRSLGACFTELEADLEILNGDFTDRVLQLGESVCRHPYQGGMLTLEHGGKTIKAPCAAKVVGIHRYRLKAGAAGLTFQIDGEAPQSIPGAWGGGRLMWPGYSLVPLKLEVIGKLDPAWLAEMAGVGKERLRFAAGEWVQLEPKVRPKPRQELAPWMDSPEYGRDPEVRVIAGWHESGAAWSVDGNEFVSPRPAKDRKEWVSGFWPAALTSRSAALEFEARIESGRLCVNIAPDYKGSMNKAPMLLEIGAEKALLGQYSIPADAIAKRTEPQIILQKELPARPGQWRHCVITMLRGELNLEVDGAAVLHGKAWVTGNRCMSFHVYPGSSVRLRNVRIRQLDDFELPPQAMHWTGAAGDSRWSSPLNWAGGRLPAPESLVVFKGASATPCLVDVNATVAGIALDYKFSGKVQLAPDRVLSVGAAGVRIAGGTFDASKGRLEANFGFFMKGGEFLAPAKTLQVNEDLSICGGRFQPNSGTLYFSHGNTFVHAGKVLFHDLVVETGGVIQANEPMHLSGTLLIKETCSFQGEPIFVEGDLVTEKKSPYSGYQMNVCLVGKGNQRIAANGGMRHLPGICIRKDGGKVTCTGTLCVNGDWLWESGKVEMAESTIVLANSTLRLAAEGMEFQHLGINTGGNVTLNGVVKVRGDLNIEAVNELCGGTIQVGGTIKKPAKPIIGTTRIERLVEAGGKR